MKIKIEQNNVYLYPENHEDIFHLGRFSKTINQNGETKAEFIKNKDDKMEMLYLEIKIAQLFEFIKTV